MEPTYHDTPAGIMRAEDLSPIQRSCYAVVTADGRLVRPGAPVLGTRSRAGAMLTTPAALVELRALLDLYLAGPVSLSGRVKAIAACRREGATEAEIAAAIEHGLSGRAWRAEATRHGVAW